MDLTLKLQWGQIRAMIWLWIWNKSSQLHLVRHCNILIQSLCFNAENGCNFQQIDQYQKGKLTIHWCRNFGSWGTYVQRNVRPVIQSLCNELLMNKYLFSQCWTWDQRKTLKILHNKLAWVTQSLNQALFLNLSLLPAWPARSISSLNFIQNFSIYSRMCVQFLS